jgi:hypothetical protein
MSGKQATIASLVRTAAKTEAEFMSTIESVFEEDEVDRIWEFFDRLNIPRSQGSEEELQGPLPEIAGPAVDKLFPFDDELRISNGVQRFLDRHERKIKWHASHPAISGVDNVVLLFRAAMSFRNFLTLVAGEWVDAMQGAVPQEELTAKLGRFYELVDAEIQRLDKLKDDIEARRRELTVVPPGYPPVKPPVYFMGDLLGKGPWKLFWQSLNDKAHHFRETVG